MRVIGLHIESDQVIGREGGFLGIRRLHLRNRREDGSLSDRYLCDFSVRPVGLDAVVVVVWRRNPDVQVLVRAGLRPPLSFGRPGETYLFLTELVAGIIEDGDDLRQRAAAEVLEEAGLTVDPETVQPLGAGMFPSPGSTAERFLFFAVEATGDAAPPEGDGSPMEEGATCRWMPLDEAIAACVRGEIEDLKTELGLRRLRARLDGTL